MADIQFGWSMPSGPREASHRASYVADLQRGLELIAGHYDSAWMIDHLQDSDAYLMEGWTALTYLAALQPRLMFGNQALAQTMPLSAPLTRSSNKCYLSSSLVSTTLFWAAVVFPILPLSKCWFMRCYQHYKNCRTSNACDRSVS